MYGRYSHKQQLKQSRQIVYRANKRIISWKKNLRPWFTNILKYIPCSKALSSLIVFTCLYFSYMLKYVAELQLEVGKELESWLGTNYLSLRSFLSLILGFCGPAPNLRVHVMTVYWTMHAIYYSNCLHFSTGRPRVHVCILFCLLFFIPVLFSPFLERWPSAWSFKSCKCGTVSK